MKAVWVSIWNFVCVMKFGIRVWGDAIRSVIRIFRELCSVYWQTVRCKRTAFHFIIHFLTRRFQIFSCPYHFLHLDTYWISDKFQVSIVQNAYDILILIHTYPYLFIWRRRFCSIYCRSECNLNGFCIGRVLWKVWEEGTAISYMQHLLIWIFW